MENEFIDMRGDSLTLAEAKTVVDMLNSFSPRPKALCGFTVGEHIHITSKPFEGKYTAHEFMRLVDRHNTVAHLIFDEA